MKHDTNNRSGSLGQCPKGVNENITVHCGISISSMREKE